MDLKSIGLKDSNESSEPETELWRGSEEQPVRQEDFVQQPAKQETVPRASEQNVVKEDYELKCDEFEKIFQRCEEL